jgi:tetratricopeptide (TPR) repeat protein
MKAFLSIVILLLFLPATALSQHDSLFTAVQTAKSGLEKARAYNALAENTAHTPEKMAAYAQKAIQLSHAENNPLEEARGWLQAGNAGILQSNYTEALRCFTKAQELLEVLLQTADSNKNSIRDELAMAYGSIGIVCSEQNNYAKALEYYFKALKLYEAVKNETVMGIAYNNIGIVYETQKEYKKALEYLQKSLWLQKKNNSPDVPVTITNIGKIHLALNEDDRALKAFTEARSGFEKHHDVRGEGELHNNMGNYYRKVKNAREAEAHYRRALQLFESTGEKFGASASLFYLGELFAQQHKNSESIGFLEKSSAMAQEIEVPEQVKDSEKALSDLYEKMGNAPLALTHYKKYSDARESINTEENIKAMVREEMNYAFEQKQALQKLENEKKQLVYTEAAKRQQQMMVFAVLFILLACGIVFLIYNRLQLKKRLTLQRDLAEYEQKALHLQMNPHFVFNCLGSISSFIVQNGTDSAIKYLAKFSKLMRLTLEYSKESLIPIDREIESLQNYLELEQLRFNQSFTFSITKDPAIEDDMALPPLLLQPFVENAIIHGIVPKKQAGVITIDFSLTNNQLVCTITDNGIGINKSRSIKERSVTVHKSLALEITRKRLEVIQAHTGKPSSVTITDRTETGDAAHGTEIILQLPVQFIKNTTP